MLLRIRRWAEAISSDVIAAATHLLMHESVLVRRMAAHTRTTGVFARSGGRWVQRVVIGVSKLETAGRPGGSQDIGAGPWLLGRHSGCPSPRSPVRRYFAPLK